MVVLRPERFVAGGDALARDDDGRAVFVRGALPGETVVATLVDEKRDWARAETIEVVEPSDDRVTPACAHRRDSCGGCDWMHVDVAAQLPAKATIVVDALRRTAKLTDPTVRLGRAAPATAYRTTIRVIADSDGRLGFRAARSHDVIATPGCLVVHPRLRSVMAEAVADPELEVTLRVSAATGETTARWNRRSGDVHALPRGVDTDDDAVVHERLGDVDLRVSSASFFQPGPDAASLLVETVREMTPELAGAAVAVDAYAGVGVFILCAIPDTCRAVAIESARSAADDAEHNLAGRDATVHHADVDRFVGDGGAVDVVIADPPRSGLGKRGVAALVALRAPVLTLVSCDPVALARDAHLLAADGYRFDHVTVVDLFPQTHHVETVARFTRA